MSYRCEICGKEPWVGKKVKVEFDQANDDVFVPFWRVVD